MQVPQGKKNVNDFPLHDCTQEQNFGLSLFFHRSTMEMAVTFKKDNFATMVMRRHTSPPLY